MSSNNDNKSSDSSEDIPKELRDSRLGHLSASDNWYRIVAIASRGGKSFFLEQEAARRGITTEELIRRLEPTAPQKEASQKMIEEQVLRDQARLHAVRDAYWANSNPDGLEFAAIHDALSEFCEVPHPTSAQCKTVFDLLPAGIIGKGIEWSFGDTEVRDEIYVFIRDNAETVTVALNKPKSPKERPNI